MTLTEFHQLTPLAECFVQGWESCVYTVGPFQVLLELFSVSKLQVSFGLFSYIQWSCIVLKPVFI